MSKWYPKNGRVIFHIDMNCFYAAVEMTYDPTLKGKPLAIAGNPEERKGIVVTSSYEARARGVKTTMPLWQAKRLCPNLIVLRPNFDRYREASRKMFKILAEITPTIQPISIDEGYLDITDSKRLESPIELAQSLQNRILKELDLPCSIGIGPNKFLAKTASDMKKPLGITVLRKRDLPKRLWPLPVEEMHGVGKKTTEKLNKIDIVTIGQLATSDVYQLTQVLGINGERLKNRANGIDPRIVDPEAINEFKSIGSSQTLPFDTTDEIQIKTVMGHLANNVEQRMKRREVLGLTVQITIRFDDRKTITRSKKLFEYVDEKEDILEIAFELLKQHWNLEPIRLLGITMQDISERKHIAHQLDIFTFEKEIEKTKLAMTINELSNKYGKDVFKRLNDKKKTSTKEKNPFTTSFQKDFLNDYKS